MRNLKLLKLVSLLLALVFVMGAIVACDDPQTPGDSSGQENPGTAPTEAICVSGEGISQYKVIYRAGATETIKSAARLLCDTLSSDFGCKISMTMDSAPKTDFEIVIGSSNRTTSEMTSALRATEYKVFVEGKTVYILAGEAEGAIEAAVNAFLGTLSQLYVEGKANITSENMNLSYTDPGFKVSSMTLNGVSITDYTIVYANDDALAEAFANNLKKAISDISGYVVTTVPDSIAYAGGKEILVGSTNRISSDDAPGAQIGKKIKALQNNNYLMYTDGDFFFIGGKNGNNIALMAAANKLINAVSSFEGEGAHNISFNYSNEVAPTETQYRIMTYNDGDLSFSGVKLTYRCNLINEYKPDIIGFQEFQAADQSKYKNQLPGYKFVYYNHENLTATHSPTNMYGAPIAYLASKFDLIESGTQWLSETPDVPNSKFSTTAYIRTYVYAILQDKTTGEQFVVVNTHLDYNGAANVKQMEVLLALTERFKGMPLVYTGDFNMRYTSESYKAMEAAGYKDAERYTKPGATSSIDYIFFDYTRMDVVNFKCIYDHTASAGMPMAGSDHNPYIVDVVIPS